MMGFITPFIEHPLLVLPTWLALNFGADAYSKACGGKYETSLAGKAARFGDRIEGSKFIQSKPAQSVIKGLGSIKSAGAKVVQNSALLRAMRDTPTMPEWSLVKSQMFNQKQEVVQEFVRIADSLKLGEAGRPKLTNVGLTKAEKEMLKKTFKVSRISEIPETKVINQVLLSRLGRSQAQIDKIQALGEKSIEATKKEILKEMGMTPEKLKLIKDDIFGKYVLGMHVKDGQYPTNGNELGCETQVGKGRVDFEYIITKLHSLNYRGPLTIEREISGENQILDIQATIEFLNNILAKL